MIDLKRTRNDQEKCPVRLIAALGSSFAAGPGIEPIVDECAMRSGANYAHLLAESLGADLIDLTVSGATTANILDSPQQTMGGMEYPPQVSGLPANADLVTITAGGNDMRFIGSMLYAAWVKAEPDGSITQILAESFGGGIPEVAEAEVDAVADGLVRIVSAVREHATAARIVLVDYLTIVTDRTPTGIGDPFSADELAALLRIQKSLAKAHRVAAARSGSDLLAVSALSGDHGVESARPWVYGLQLNPDTTMASFHPNRYGMQAVADELVRMLATGRTQRSVIPNSLL
jgi:lysophospholipase L1-like esterase